MPEMAAVWRPEELSCGWLSAALAEPLAGAEVVGFEVEPVGTGQMADSFRLTLRTDRPAPLTTVVGKFTAADENSRSTAVSMRTSEVEVRFYQQTASSLPARTPRCHHADVDVDTARFVLLLEDVAPARQGDQVAGCTVDEAAMALDELAMVHAPRWGDPGLRTLDWLDRRNETSLAFLEALFPGMFAGFAERYGDALAEPIGPVGAAFFPRIGTYLRLEAAVPTVQHADFRVDNLLFGADGGTRVAVVDWQTVALGPGAADVAYFLGGSIEVEDRRTHEKDLLQHYLGRLRSLGVEDYDFDELWEDYRRYAFAGLVMAVGAAMTVARTDRGDDMFLAMARRAAAHAEDLGSLDLLGGT